jgi:hypothetical protein
MSNQENVYTIPLQYRKMENLHIIFWLLKDIGWCMIWRPLGIAMVFPTLIIAIVITYRNRQNMGELCHNTAIAFWISANSYWMISEFLHFDTLVVSGAITYKHLAMIPFIIGLLILGYFYIWWKPTQEKK